MFARIPLSTLAGAALLIGLSALPTSSGAVRAAEPADVLTLEDACKDLANQVEKALLEEKLGDAKSIVIQSFTSSTNFPNAQINLLLKSAFESRQYKVQDKAGAPAFLKGTLYVSKTTLVIETDLHKVGEGRLHTWKHRVDSVEAASQGATYDTKAASTVASSGGAAFAASPKEKVAAALAQDSVKPQVAIAGNGFVARPTPDSKYGVCLFTMKDGALARMPVTNVEGLAIVDLAMDQEFGVIVVNDSGEDVGASISIDGVNIFNFSQIPEYKSQGKMWIGPQGGQIDGWYHHDKESRKFRMGKYDDSVAAQMGVTEGLGGITVTFYAEQKGGARGIGSRGLRSDVGIGQGTVVASDYHTKSGHFGDLIAAVTVRYQSANHPKDLPPGK
jgi:hypothetical protein